MRRLVKRRKWYAYNVKISGGIVDVGHISHGIIVGIKRSHQRIVKLRQNLK